MDTMLEQKVLPGPRTHRIIDLELLLCDALSSNSAQGTSEIPCSLQLVAAGMCPQSSTTPI